LNDGNRHFFTCNILLNKGPDVLCRDTVQETEAFIDVIASEVAARMTVTDGVKRIEFP
jgi:hypothetical protein